MCIVLTDHFRGTGRAVGPVCLCYCVASGQWSITFQWNDVWPRYLSCWFMLIVSRSGSVVGVTGNMVIYRRKAFSLENFGRLIHYLCIICCAIWSIDHKVVYKVELILNEFCTSMPLVFCSFLSLNRVCYWLSCTFASHVHCFPMKLNTYLVM